MIARLAFFAASFSVPLGIIWAAVRSQGPGLTRGGRDFLEDQYPQAVVESVNATIRAANRARR